MLLYYIKSLNSNHGFEKFHYDVKSTSSHPTVQPCRWPCIQIRVNLCLSLFIKHLIQRSQIVVVFACYENVSHFHAIFNHWNERKPNPSEMHAAVTACNKCELSEISVNSVYVYNFVIRAPWTIAWNILK